jgi:D-lactate dehydrogenase (cytochrome)
MLIKRDQSSIKSYFEDSSNLKGGHADSIVIPENIEELSGFVKKANIDKLPITISGGGTGTTGSRIPFGGAVVSLEKFNKIIDISKECMCAVAQAGVLVEDFKNACAKKGLFYASHPTEKAAFLGGTISTNASGARSFKYGPTGRQVKRLKMVLATGAIFEIKRGEKILTRKDSVIPLPAYKIPNVKNSAGYFAGEGTDYIDLFIGQEAPFR